MSVSHCFKFNLKKHFYVLFFRKKNIYGNHHFNLVCIFKPLIKITYPLTFHGVKLAYSLIVFLFPFLFPKLIKEVWLNYVSYSHFCQIQDKETHLNIMPQIPFHGYDILLCSFTLYDLIFFLKNMFIDILSVGTQRENLNQ